MWTLAGFRTDSQGGGDSKALTSPKVMKTIEIAATVQKSTLGNFLRSAIDASMGKIIPIPSKQ